MMLLLDQGNHRLKWRQRPENGALPSPVASAAWDGNWREALGVDLAPHAAGFRALVASVAGAARYAELRSYLEGKGATEVTLAVPGTSLGGVRNGYRDPVRLGIDRWCALVAAYRRSLRAVLVADVGTAWTFDLVDGNARHLGGWIAPGPTTQREALHAATAALPRLGAANEEPRGPGDLPRWGQDTEEAMRGGVRATLLGFLAIAEEAARLRVGAEFMRIATGGDREALSILGARGYTIVEELVLEGLALYADPRTSS
jgi:type III pantothenate kinase